MPKTISDAISWWGRALPENVAVAVDDDRVAFGAFNDWVDRVADRLTAMGFRPGDRIGGLSNHSVEYCALIFGALRAGGIFVPLGLRLTPHELAELLADFSPSLLFADAGSTQKAAGLGLALLNTADIAALRTGPKVRFELELLPLAPVLIMCTSGSTAKPKGVVLTNNSIIEGATQYAMEDVAFSPGGRTLLLPPMSVSAATVQMMNHLVLGCSVYFQGVFDAKRAFRILVDEKITLFGAPPLFLERIAALPEFAQADLSHIAYAYTGGARVPKSLLELWCSKGVIYRQMYGITEAGGMATINPKHLALELPDKCGTGRIFNKIRIVDESRKQVPAGVEGEIALQSPDMMLGYWNNPEATAEVLEDGWLYTGDIGVVDENGLLQFVDRKKDLIVSGGLKIAAAEVERAVAEYEGIEEVAVIAAFDAKFGETPMAIIYAQAGVSIPNLISHCNDRLADYKVPRYVVVSESPLPRLAAGKISKPELRKLYKGTEAKLQRVR